MLLNKDRQRFLKGVKRLRTDKDDFEQEVIDLRRMKSKLENLQRQGVVDEHGDARIPHK